MKIKYERMSHGKFMWCYYGKGFWTCDLNLIIGYFRYLKIKRSRIRQSYWTLFKNPWLPTYEFRIYNHLAQNHVSIIPRGKLIHLLK